MDMHTRAAVTADVETIAQMWHQGWHDGHADVVAAELTALRTAHDFVRRAHAHLAQTVVAEIDGEIAGFFMLAEDELYQFYIAPARKGSGAARDLMAAAEAALSPRRAWLACSEGNERAAAFYRKCGWTHVRTGPYAVETSAGPREVTEWRFEKTV